MKGRKRPLSPPGPGLLRLLDLIGAPDDSRRAALRLREAELAARWRAARARATARVSDGVAKFGGGSLLTTAVAVAIGGQLDWRVIVLAGLTLLAFVIGTISFAVSENRAVDYDLEADRLAAARTEVDREQ